MRGRGGRAGARAPRPLTGAVTVPGDKSISHRALILAALASGTSRLVRLNTGEDVAATAGMLRSLGVSCLQADNHQAHVEGRGRGGLGEPDSVLDAGNSGTSLRLLAGVCAGVDGLSILTGDGSLRRRPMLRVVAPLRQMGARIDGRDHGDLAPLAIRGGGSLVGVDIELPVASAQVKSALLLAGHLAEGTTTVIEPGPSRDHTERMMAAVGLRLQRSEGSVSIAGGGDIEPFDIVVPGDLSSAMFLVVAALIVPGSDLTISEVGLNPTRTAALEVLRSMGADLAYEVEREELGEPVGHVRVRHSELNGVEVPTELVPALIDEVPALAVAASQAAGTTVFSGVQELRVKESDRIAAIAEGLTALSGRVDVAPDGFAVHGPTTLTAGVVDPRRDHRIAMAFAVAGAVADGKVRVEQWSCVDTSFPEFLDVMGEATRKK